MAVLITAGETRQGPELPMGKHSERKRWSNGALISIMNANLSANQCWGPLSADRYISK